MNYSIRLMSFLDKEEVLQMMIVFYESEAVLSNGSNEIFNSDFDNCVNDNPYLEGYVFCLEDKILGYAMIAKSFSTEFGKPCIWIEDLYIKDEYRNKGIGSKFFKFIEEKYPNTIMRLEVEESNEVALHVYKKEGFKILPYIELKKELD